MRRADKRVPIRRRPSTASATTSPLFPAQSVRQRHQKMSADVVKRMADDDDAIPTAKRARNEVTPFSSSSSPFAVPPAGPPRTSNLESRIMQLSGHQGEVFSCKFHPDGETLASAGYDRQLFLWSTYGECENLASLSGHRGAILEVCFSATGDRVFTASADKTVNMWDTPSCTRIKKLKGHSAVVNCCSAARNSEPLLVTASDDCTVRIWDTRTRYMVNSIRDKFQVLACSFNENANQVIYGGIENTIKVYDIRKNDVLFELIGHFDSVTGLAVSPDGSFVLSNSMDNTLCVWDIRPYAPQERCVKTLHGHSHNFEKNLLRCSWSPDGGRVSAGSACRNVFVWDVLNKRVLYKLPGHQGSVNDVQFHPREPILLSASSDKHLFLGEIE